MANRLGASTRTSRTIRARPEDVYAAFVDPHALAQWLPPGDMTGKVHAFDGQVGGGYEMSLFYPEADRSRRGKTAEREDRVKVRFLTLEPPRRLVEAIVFASDDPAYGGQMRMTATFEDAPDGTEVTLLFENLPPGVRPEDNDEGARQSLEKLAARFET